ncbi:MAG: hypothetical protein OQJ81_06660, partial [Melioribacteraceae bacterium]|nr:hypothetical protein [Melioribacteraceae bacterium]
DRVILKGDGYEDFKSSAHGKLGCVTCHNGVENAAGDTDTEIKNNAHSGDFLAAPSLLSDQKCASCHPDVVARAKNSTHEQGWGQKSMVTLRYKNETGMEAFASLPDDLKHGYKGNCQGCHATCAECHVTRPTAGGGGLSNGHQFGKPDMRKNCTTCHVSRGGHAYFGEGIGTVPDVHLTNAGFTCMDCHSKNEIHGDGNYYDQRYKNDLLPECTDCHGDLKNSNTYHSVHMDSFNCQTCHSQDYNNCGSCHIPSATEDALHKVNGGVGARIAAHLKFKIGMNPLEHKPYKMATLRQSLSAPDSWDQNGIANLDHFDVRPAYKYTTPHNIIKWTQRTIVDSVIDASQPSCAQACHILKDKDGNFVNKQYYLFESDLIEPWEKSSTSKYTVDGKLPASWKVN